MTGFRGCFLCGKTDHQAAERHTLDEVTRAVRKLKSKHPSTRITTADKAYITELFEINRTSSDEQDEAYFAVDE